MREDGVVRCLRWSVAGAWVSQVERWREVGGGSGVVIDAGAEVNADVWMLLLKPNGLVSCLEDPHRLVLRRSEVSREVVVQVVAGPCACVEEV